MDRLVPWDFTPQLEEVFYVNRCVTCVCDSYYSVVYLLVDVFLNGHHKMRDQIGSLLLLLYRNIFE